MLQPVHVSVHVCLYMHVHKALPVHVQDDATVQELTAEDVTKDVKGWVQRTCSRLFPVNLYAGMASNATVMRIHSTAEVYDATAEAFTIPFQVSICIQQGHFLPF